MNEKIKKTTTPPPASAARVAANRKNAQKSTGPTSVEGKAKSSQNSASHGLTGRMCWAGENAEQEARIFHRAWSRIGPRNIVEELAAASLLQSRARDRFLMTAERTLLVRKPVLRTLSPATHPFPLDGEGLRALDQLARQIAHLTRVVERDFKALLAARKLTSSQKEAAPSSNNTLDGLSELQADHSALIDGEEGHRYEDLAEAFWNAYQPANLLERFVVGDIVVTQHRLDRVLEMQTLLLSQRALSATGENCGFGFAFLHDCALTHALESLRNFEAVLRKRIHSRTGLFQKIREAQWRDATPLEPEI